jgi:hypothetical protein
MAEPDEAAGLKAQLKDRCAVLIMSWSLALISLNADRPDSIRQFLRY